MDRDGVKSHYGPMIRVLRLYRALPSKVVGIWVQPLPLAMFVGVISLATATYFAVTIDRFGWDVDITRALQDFRLGSFKFPRGLLFWMGVRGVAGAILLVAVAVFWFQGRRLGALFLFAIGIPDVFNFLLRHVVARPRPSEDFVEVIGGSQGYSFPSGTSLHVVLFYGFLLYLLSGSISSRRLLYSIWAIAVVYIGVTGLLLIYDGRHWFTDVMGGYMYGGFFLLVWIVLYRRAEVWIRGEQARVLVARFPGYLRKPAEFGLRLLVTRPDSKSRPSPRHRNAPNRLP